MNLTTDKLQGHAGWRWSLPQGDSVFVAQQGAQVLSWQTGGQERLYLSPVSACDGTTAIRGGIPVAFRNLTNAVLCLSMGLHATWLGVW